MVRQGPRRCPREVERVREGDGGQAVAAVRPWLVHVQAVDPKGAFAAGSGLLLDHWHAVAAAQVVGAEDQVTVFLGEGRRVGASVLSVDPVYPLAVLRLEARAPAGAPPLAPDPPAPGSPVLSVGCPFGPEVVVSAGVVSATDLTVYRQDRIPVDGLLATDAALHPGSLGGPLVSPAGQVLGVSAMPWLPGFHLAVQADVVVRLAGQIIDFGRATHPWLGFSGQAEVIDDQLRALFGLPVTRGLVVSHVAPGGPGERAGVQVFDMVVRVDGGPVDTVGAIRRRLSAFRPGDEATLTILRGGKLVDIPFPVEEIPRLQGAGQG